MTLVKHHSVVEEGEDSRPSLCDSKARALGSVVEGPAAATQAEPRGSALCQASAIPKQTVPWALTAPGGGREHMGT